jgi:hypothetical protein
MRGLERKHIPCAEIPEALLDTMILAVEAVCDHGTEGNPSVHRLAHEFHRHRQFGPKVRISPALLEVVGRYTQRVPGSTCRG